MTTPIIGNLDAYLGFRLGEETFAVNIGHVTRIMELVPATRVPHAPPHYKGVINLFGEVIPVIDGRLKFGLPPAEPTRDTCIVVTVLEQNGEVQTAGLVVDSVQKVYSIAASDIKKTPVLENHEPETYIRGVARLNNQFILIMDVEAIFKDSRFSFEPPQLDEPIN